MYLFIHLYVYMYIMLYTISEGDPRLREEPDAGEHPQGRSAVHGQDLR